MMEKAIAFFLFVCLVCFFSANFYNFFKTYKRKDKEKVYAEVERPKGVAISLAALGTIAYFIEVFLYLFLALAEAISMENTFLFTFQFPFLSYLMGLGLVLTSIGYFLFIWSVITRGKYSVSWEMPENQRLVTHGPYRHVRHPSYLGYFLMFIGLFLLWPNPSTVVPSLAIPGYIRITYVEESLLIRRFGEEYVKYQEKTGRLIPRFR